MQMDGRIGFVPFLSWPRIMSNSVWQDTRAIHRNHFDNETRDLTMSPGTQDDNKLIAIQF